MLVDLLERKVVPRESVNGLVGNREIRISDRGLELVDAIEADSNSRSSTPPPAVPPTSNHIPTSTPTTTVFNTPFSSSGIMVNSDSTNSTVVVKNQQMTFYSASGSDHQIPADGVINNCGPEDRPLENCFGSSEHEMVLMSGGGGGGEGNSANHEEEEKDTVEISMDDADLLEKFNEISDLIVVSPEQLGLKRSRSSSEDNCLVEEPPSKKKLTDPSASAQGNSVQNAPPAHLPPLPPPEPIESPVIPKTVEEETGKVVSTLDPPPPTTANTVTVVTTSNGIQGKPLVQAPGPTRLTLNNPTPQYAFARPLVFSAGQQILLQTPHNSGSLHGAKVLISKPANSSGDQRQQAYFILQPQQATSTSAPAAIKISTSCGIPLSTTSFPALSPSSNNNIVSTTNSVKVQPCGRVEVPMQCSVPPGSRASSPNILVTNPLTAQQAFRKTSDQLDLEFPYLCEWLDCGQRFLKHEQVKFG